MIRVDPIYEVFSGLRYYEEVSAAIISGQLDLNGSVYVGDGLWILPGGDLLDDEDDED